MIQAHGDEVAAIVMEPQRGAAPEPGFLEGVRAKATEIGAVLVFDEITTGFRTHLAGIHMLHNVEPDIAVFAKALGNGYAMAAVIGTTEVMDAAQSTFISSTNWTERLGLVAALATLKKLKDSNAHARINGVGQQVKSIWKEAAGRNNLSIHVSGLDCGPHMHFEEDIGNLPLMTLFGQEMLKRGFLAASLFNASLAHSDDDVAEYGRAVGEVFGILSEAKSEGSVERYLDGPVAQGGFYRFVP